MLTRHLRAVIATLALLVGMPVQAARPKGSDAHAEGAFVAKQAIEYDLNGQFAMAAQLYRRAFRIDKSKPEYLFGVGHSEEKAGCIQEAIVAYQKLMRLVPATDPLAKQAKAALEALQTPAADPVALAPADPAPVAAPVAVGEPAPVVAAPAPPSQPQADWKRSAGIASLAAGGAVLIASAVLAGAALLDQSRLDGNKLRETGSYDPARITSAQVRSRQSGVNNLWTGAAVTGGIAAVAGGFGAWALLTAPESVTLAPGPGNLGVVLALRF